MTALLMALALYTQVCFKNCEGPLCRHSGPTPGVMPSHGHDTTKEVRCLYISH